MTNCTYVKDIMSRFVFSIDSSISANEAAKTMEDTKVSALIVTEYNTRAGIITEHDFAVKIAAHAYPLDTPVRRIMSSPLIAVEPSESIWSALKLMIKKQVHKIVVIENNQVVGIVTKTDLIKQLSLPNNTEVKEKFISYITDIYNQNVPLSIK